VARVQRADALLDAGRFGRQHGAAHEKKQIVDAFAPQCLGQNFRAVQFRHRASPSEL
jgi:hypothetical protein